MSPTPTPVALTPEFSVSPQITIGDVAALKAMGFHAILCNRPDDEDPGQTPAAAIGAEAARLGLAFAHVPVVSGGILPEDVAAFRDTLDGLPGPVLAYCRSGTRCRNLHGLATRRG